MGRAANTIEDNNPCLSADGVRKERWPNALAAWYVVELCLLGKHGRLTAGKKLYAYHCPKPECDGWHLASCRNREDRKRHRRGLEELRSRMKTSQRAGKKKGIT